jgi:sugar/nucleoside kinase (ribokinase family)
MEIVFSDGETRTVFGRYCNLLLTQRQWEKPSEKAIRQSDLVCLDPFFKEESLQAAELAQKYRIPYVTVDCAPDDHICIHAAAAVISQEYRRRTCGQTPDDQLFLKYQNKAKGLIIFTAGGEEIIYGRFGQEPEVLYPKKIIPVDTSGAGDAFRAGVVWGVLQKWQDKKIISFATALAAKVCRSTPGVLGKL